MKATREARDDETSFKRLVARQAALRALAEPMSFHGWEEAAPAAATTKFRSFTANVGSTGSGAICRANLAVPGVTFANGTLTTGGAFANGTLTLGGTFANGTLTTGGTFVTGRQDLGDVVSNYVVDIPSCAQALLTGQLPTIYVSGTATAPPPPIVSLEERLAGQLKQVLAASLVENDQHEDTVSTFVENASEQYGIELVHAIESLINKGGITLADKERLIRALGLVRNPAAIDHASEILIGALTDSDVQIRDAVVSAMSLGAHPDHYAHALSAAAQVEPIAVLRSAMLQTAEQLVTWSRRRAALAKDRSKKVAGSNV